MADPQQGDLRTRSYLPACKQDPVTKVVTDPVQTVQEKTGRFYPGCGHSINSFEILFEKVAGVKKALIVCPICGYIQRIADPAEVADDTYVIG